MLDDGRKCKDVVTQISATTRALEQAGFKLVVAGLTYCITHPDEAEARLAPRRRREDVPQAHLSNASHEAKLPVLRVGPTGCVTPVAIGAS